MTRAVSMVFRVNRIDSETVRRAEFDKFPTYEELFSCLDLPTTGWVLVYNPAPIWMRYQDIADKKVFFGQVCFTEEEDRPVSGKS